MSPRRFSPGSAGEDPRDERFRLPPALSRLPEGDHRLPREFIEQNQRNRILLAALDVFGEKGFAAASVQDLIDRASTSRATFYKYFADKGEALRAVHDEVLGWLEEQARDAAREAEDWSAGVVAVCDRLLALFLDDPRLPRICGIESLLGGPDIQRRQEAALASLEEALRLGRAERAWGKKLPTLLEPLLLTGTLSLTVGSIGLRADPGAGALRREIPELILVPYLGIDDARRAVRGAA